MCVRVCQHPDVITGRLTADQVFTTFLQSFEGVAGNKDGKVRWTAGVLVVPLFGVFPVTVVCARRSLRTGMLPRRIVFAAASVTLGGVLCLTLQVTLAEFLDYYGDIGASVPSDDYFVEMMESCWMITESPPTAELEAKVAAWADVVREKVRQKTTATGSEDVKLRQVFKFFDTDESGAVTIDEFGRAMERLGYVVLCVQLTCS